MSTSFYMTDLDGLDGHLACQDQHVKCVRRCSDFREFHYCGHMEVSREQCPICRFDINWSFSSTSKVLDALGLDHMSPSAGRILPERLHGRCAIALEKNQSETPTVDRLIALSNLSLAAIRLGHSVSWG